MSRKDYKSLAESLRRVKPANYAAFDTVSENMYTAGLEQWKRDVRNF